MLVDSRAEDIILSASLTGIPANWLRASLEAAGFDPKNMPDKQAINLGRPEDQAKKRWKEVWSAGQGVGAVREIEPVSQIVDELAREYATLR